MKIYRVEMSATVNSVLLFYPPLEIPVRQDEDTSLLYVNDPELGIYEVNKDEESLTSDVKLALKELWVNYARAQDNTLYPEEKEIKQFLNRRAKLL